MQSITLYSMFANNAQIRLSKCCDNKLSVIETADKFKIC